MSGAKARKNIDKEANKWLRLRNEGKLTNAEILEKARILNISYKDSAMSLNTLGMVLTWCFDEERKSNPQIAQAYLEEGCGIYLKAHTRVPSCLWTRLQYCRKLLGFGEYAKIWEILNPADEIQGCECDDPMNHNALLPQEMVSLSTGQERVHYVLHQYDALKSYVRNRLVDDLASKTIVNRRKQVQALIRVTPKEFRFQHISFLTCLWSAYNSETDGLRRFLLQQSLGIVDSVSKDYKKSILLSLYRARMLFALGRFADAESECLRGLEMKCPADPIVDGILYSMDTNNHFDGEFQATGDTEKDRVEYIKGHLKFLLRLISSRLKGYWDSLAWFDRDSYLTSRFDVLVEHYKEANPFVQRALNNALKFFETHRQWEYWICPVCSEGLIMSIDKLWSHLCNLHGYKSFHKPSCEQKCCEMFLWKYQEKLLLTLGDRELVYNIYPAKHMSFEDLKEARSRERRDRFSEFKAAGDNIDESNKLWHQLLKACHISYCEYLVPFLRLYHRAKLLEVATEVFTKKEISREDMNSVFWAACDESEIHQETEEDRKDDTLQVKYSELDNRYLQYWTEKRNRGYKWFSDVDLPDFKEYKFTCFSSAAGDPLCKFTAQQAIDTHQQTNVQRLIITDLKVPGCKSALNYAWMTGTRLRSPMVPCVATLKKPKQEINLIFDLLTRCRHPNILKPLGVWPDCDDPSMGYIILPHVDGAISTISRNELFLEDSNVIDSFSENGFKIFRDIMSGVQYVNTHYSTPLLGGNEVLRHFPLNISLNSIYYIRNVTGEYQIYLGDFTVESPEESNKVNVDELITSNWNAMGIFLDKLCAERVVDEELTHLINVLMGPSVKYDDLVWEPGMWTVSEKMTFIREVFWIQRSYVEKRDELGTKQPLGLESFAKKVSPDMVRKEQHMQSDFMFLRNTVLGHQDAIYHSYKGAKEEIGIKKATIEKLLRKEAPGCIIKLVEGIRALKWCILSPFRRSPDESQRWHESMFPARKHQPSGPAAQTPQQPPSSS